MLVGFRKRPYDWEATEAMLIPSGTLHESENVPRVAYSGAVEHRKRTGDIRWESH